MKNLKSLILTLAFFISQSLLASEWNHLNLHRENLDISLSYTKQYHPATYGFNGGTSTGKFFIDIRSRTPFIADTAEILVSNRFGTMSKLGDIQFNENNPYHSYAEVVNRYPASLEDFIWIGTKSYVIRMIVNGKQLELFFKLH